MDRPWRITMFGGLRAERDERVITRFGSQTYAALLAYLAFFRERSHPREVLIDLFWPQIDPDVYRHNLRTAVYRLRRRLEPGAPLQEPLLGSGLAGRPFKMPTA